MKRLLLFLARLVAISLLLVPLLPWFKKAYTAILHFSASGSLEALTYDGSNNLYTFVVLMLGIPGVTKRKRIAAIATGTALFLTIDFFMAVIWPTYLKTPRPSLANMAVSYGWLVTAHYLLPFLLWFAFAFKEIEVLFRGEVLEHGKPT